MAYDAAVAQPLCMVPRFGSGPALWYYASEDVHTAVDETDYITNGLELGMKVNDIVFVVKTTATVGATLHSVLAIDADGNASLSPAILA